MTSMAGTRKTCGTIHLLADDFSGPYLRLIDRVFKSGITVSEDIAEASKQELEGYLEDMKDSWELSTAFKNDKRTTDTLKTMSQLTKEPNPNDDTLRAATLQEFVQSAQAACDQFVSRQIQLAVMHSQNPPEFWNVFESGVPRFVVTSDESTIPLPTNQVAPAKTLYYADDIYTNKFGSTTIFWQTKTWVDCAPCAWALAERDASRFESTLTAEMNKDKKVSSLKGDLRAKSSSDFAGKRAVFAGWGEHIHGSGDRQFVKTKEAWETYKSGPGDPWRKATHMIKKQRSWEAT